jgi:hypothetical protein
MPWLQHPFRIVRAAVAAALCVAAVHTHAAAQGGLYIAGDGFSFQTAAERAMRQNSGGRQFFLLVLPKEARALSTGAPASAARLRDRVITANGVLLVCQRDLDSGRIAAAGLVPGIVAVRGWPAKGSTDLPAGQRLFPGEDLATLPAANEALRKLRSACS